MRAVRVSPPELNAEKFLDEFSFDEKFGGVTIK